MAEPKPRKPWSAKKKITLGVIALVIVGAGIGFYVWHNTPGFCDAICHKPQDPYNPTYYAEPGQPATDKWGNPVADAYGMLSAVHRAKEGMVCIDCHKPVMKEQIIEGIEWVKGDFYYPLSERNLTNLVYYRGIPAEEFCLNPDCHDTTRSGLTELTAFLERNPHAWHHIEYTCTDCHKAHRASIMVCADCHPDSVVFRGWITPEAARNLPTVYGQYDWED
ncbi:MAG: cytochrome c3 family protein [Eggerthellaceae bacterium]|nr:cytochrome c3 family protein [Eggerthellaceae bacterium]